MNDNAVFLNNPLKSWKCYIRDLIVKLQNRGISINIHSKNGRLMCLKRLRLLLHLLAYIIRKQLCSRFQSSIHYSMFPPIFLLNLIKMF